MARRARATFDAEDADYGDDVKLEEPRALEPRVSSRGRIENLRDRMQLFYGSGDADLVRAIELRVKWGALLFSIPEAALAKPSQTDASGSAADPRSADPTPADLTSTADLTSADLTPADFTPAGWPCVVDGFVLGPHEVRRCSNAAVLNAGHAVLSLDWSRLLAVAVRVTAEAPIDASSIGDAGDLGDGLVHVYSADRSDVVRLYTFAARGVRQVAWRPGDSHLCVLAGAKVYLATAFADRDLEQCVTVPEIGHATCVHWRTRDDLVVGYADGHVAEFSLDLDGAGITASYVVRPHSSVVTALASSDFSLFTTSVDGWSCVYADVRDKRLVARAPRLRYFASSACYSAAADSFVCLEDADTTRLVPKRRPELVQTQTALTRHRAGVASVATSEAHPLVISGGHDGELHITNPLRRTLATRRSRDTHYDCTVWRLECAHKTSEFRFVDVLRAAPVDKRKAPSHLPLFPASVAVLSVAWQPNSSWYAAGTASGLVRLESVAE